MKMGKIFTKYTETSLVLRILIGLIIGAALGLAIPQATAIGILGDVFVGALKAVAPVLVFFLVMSSISKAGSGIGSRFRTVIVLYMLSTLLAAVVAVVGSFLFPVQMVLSEAAENTPPEGIAEVLSNILTNNMSIL